MLAPVARGCELASPSSKNRRQKTHRAFKSRISTYTVLIFILDRPYLYLRPSLSLSLDRPTFSTRLVLQQLSCKDQLVLHKNALLMNVFYDGICGVVGVDHEIIVFIISNAGIAGLYFYRIAGVFEHSKNLRS